MSTSIPALLRGLRLALGLLLLLAFYTLAFFPPFFESRISELDKCVYLLVSMLSCYGLYIRPSTRTSKVIFILIVLLANYNLSSRALLPPHEPDLAGVSSAVALAVFSIWFARAYWLGRPILISPPEPDYTDSRTPSS